MMDQEYQHQKTAAELLDEYNEYALIMEQGTGKSRPVIKDWLTRIQDGRAQDLVVIGPKGAYMNWIGNEEEPGELTKWIPPETLAGISVAPWITGARAAQRDALANLLRATRPRFLCMNVEALSLKTSQARKYLLHFTQGRKVIGVIDESTTIAHENAYRTEFILESLAQKFVTRRILTGLVAPESPLDLFSQYAYLDWRIIGQRSFWGFKNRYAIMEKVNFTPAAMKATGKMLRDVNVVVGYRNLEELHEKIFTRSYRVLKADCLDLPPKIYQFYDVEMTEEQARIYCDMRDIATARLENGEFSTATMKLDQLGKLQHILCGHVRNETGELTNIPENRVKAITEILHNHSGKAIIWAPYPQALRKIVNALRKEFGEDSTVGFWGEHNLDERMEARARIQNDDLCRFIVSNQSVGKFGNTWTACNLVIYFANSFDNEDRQQSEDRPHRIGQTKSVTYIDLRAVAPPAWQSRIKTTVNDRLIHVLRKKINIASAIHGDEFRKWLV